MDNKGFSNSAISALTEPVQALNKAASVVIVGVFKVNSTLTCNITDANGVPVNIDYQWLANGIEVGGASAYTLTEADKGKIISLSVQFTDKDGFIEDRTSLPTEPVAPLNKSAAAAIVGVLQAGKILKAVIVDDNGVPSNITYKWMANSVEVGAATTYTLTENDVGKTISLRVIFTDNDGFIEDKTTASTAVVRSARPIQEPPEVLPANTPFTFKTTRNVASSGELGVNIIMYEPSANWALYRGDVLVAEEGLEGIGITYTGSYDESYVKITTDGSSAVNSYKLVGSAKRLEVNRYNVSETGVPHGTVDIQGFSSSINHYNFKIDSSLLTVPSKLASHITRTDYMFDGCDLFNQNISTWNMVNVTIMDKMFAYCSSFNQPIGNWNTSNVVYMNGVFDECLIFNQPLENWDVSNVVDMTALLSGAKVFNQPLENWDVSNVQSMDYMFIGCHKFNQDLSQWCVPDKSVTIEGFDTNTFDWVKPRPVWGTCPRGEDAPY